MCEYGINQQKTYEQVYEQKKLVIEKETSCLSKELEDRHLEIQKYLQNSSLIQYMSIAKNIPYKTAQLQIIKESLKNYRFDLDSFQNQSDQSAQQLIQMQESDSFTDNEDQYEEEMDDELNYQSSEYDDEINEQQQNQRSDYDDEINEQQQDSSNEYESFESEQS